MFLRKRVKELEMEVQCLKSESERLRDDYWKMWHKHHRLMDHLGLYEHKKRGVEIRRKNGHESGG